jgi:hypothetical protein
MTEWSAQGGHCLIGGVQVPIAETRLVGMARLADATTSAGVKRKTVLREGQGSFSAPWDSDRDPTDIGIRDGAEAVLYGLLLGASGFEITGMVIIIENVERVQNPTNDVCRVTVNFYVQGFVPDPVPVS